MPQHNRFTELESYESLVSLGQSAFHGAVDIILDRSNEWENVNKATKSFNNYTCIPCRSSTNITIDDMECLFRGAPMVKSADE